jgi:hypothetical protein
MSGSARAVSSGSPACKKYVSVLAIDLAAKYSAVCEMDEDYSVAREFDSWQRTEEQFLFACAQDWYLFDGGPAIRPEIMVVEDLPHGLGYTQTVKAVCRLQGRLAQVMHDSYHGDYTDMLFVAPRAWRGHYGEDLKRGTGAAAVVPVAAKFGYRPHIAGLMQRAKGNGGKTRADKVATDYCSAYLIARWAIDMKREHGTYDVPGTSRYGSAELRKKDLDAESHDGDEKL